MQSAMRCLTLALLAATTSALVLPSAIPTAKPALALASVSLPRATGGSGLNVAGSQLAFATTTCRRAPAPCMQELPFWENGAFAATLHST